MREISGDQPERLREQPGWSTVALVGLLLLVLGGLLGVVFALALLLVRARRQPQRAHDSLPLLPRDVPLATLLCARRRPAALVLLTFGIDAVALLTARYIAAGGVFLWSVILGAPMDLSAFIGMLDATLPASLVFVAGVLFLLMVGGRYARHLSRHDTHQLFVRSVLLGAGLELAWFALAHGELASVGLLCVPIAVGLLPAARTACERLLELFALHERVTLLVGERAAAERAFVAMDGLGDHDVYRVPDVPSALPEDLDGEFSSLAGRDLAHLEVVLCPGLADFEGAVRLCRSIEARGIACLVAVDLGESGSHGLDSAVALRNGVFLAPGVLRRGRAASMVFKRAIDVAGALIGILLFTPLVLLLAVRILSDGGPLFFAHERVGRYGRRFRCLKLRTMRADAEAVLARLLEDSEEARQEWSRDFKLKRDPRITPFGEFLRRTSLDELPQFINVLKGDMSLVGPRPIVQEELERYYGADAASYLSIKPGLTGLWQISGRNDLSYAQRVALDSRYAREWSVGGDLMIMLRSIEIVVYGRGAY